MTDEHIQACERILTAFFQAHPHPTRADWWSLIVDHPEHASCLADACLLARSAAPWDPFPWDTRPPPSSTTDVENNRGSRSVREERQLDAIDERIHDLGGSSLRAFAVGIGLAGHLNLVDGVLAGRIVPPVGLLWRMARWLRTTPDQLSLVLVKRQQGSGRSPRSSIGAKRPPPLAWDEAVLNEGLSEAKTHELLTLMGSSIPI